MEEFRSLLPKHGELMQLDKERAIERKTEG